MGSRQRYRLVSRCPATYLSGLVVLEVDEGVLLEERILVLLGHRDSIARIGRVVVADEPVIDERSISRQEWWGG